MDSRRARRARTRAMRQVPAAVLTDCRSVYDLCRKVGSLPQERRVALDLLDVRESLERDGSSIRWAPTDAQPADVLTKAGVDPTVLHRIMRTGRFTFKYDLKATKLKKAAAALVRKAKSALPKARRLVKGLT